MKTFPRIHDVYVGRIVFGTVLLVWVVLLGLDLMLGFVSEFGDIGRGNYGTPQAILYMAFSVPRRAYTLFPYAAVVGALMALGQLAASSELTALRAATVQLSVPPLAALGGALLLSEALTPRLVLASAAILGGVALVLLSRAARAR